MTFQGDADDNEVIAADGDAALHEALVRGKARPRRTKVDIRPFSGSDDGDILEWLIC